MNKVNLSNTLDKTTYVIKAYDKGELYSEGSAFCFNQNGMLITAAHVVTGRLPIREEDYKSENIKIVGRTKKGRLLEYRTIICGIKINWPDGPLKEPLEIDLAILEPVEKQDSVPFLEIENSNMPVGTEVLMAGFPDELELPLQWDKSLDKEYLEKKQSVDEIQHNMQRVKELLIMIKTGMIGFSDGLVINPGNQFGWALNLGVYYIDNVMHSGASGGPVINEKGKAVGVITKRAVTSVSYPDLDNPKKDVPSGSALAITPSTIIDFVNHQFKSQEIESVT